VTASPLDHPLLGGLLGDAEVAAQLSADADLTQMTLFESALAIAEGAEEVIPADAAAAIAQRLASFAPDVAGLRGGAVKDGVVVPALIRQMRAHVGEPHGRFVHFGATSQDVIDTSLMLRVQVILNSFEQRLLALRERNLALTAGFGRQPLMGRTRMQDALPITVADRLAAWQGPVDRALERLAQLRPRLMVLQLGGPVGTLSELGGRDAGAGLPATELAEPARLDRRVRILAVAGDRCPGQDRAGRGADGAEPSGRDRARGGRCLIGDGA
jgi:3-carboxy-cis,cis-muconate cycloisomerase